MNTEDALLAILCCAMGTAILFLILTLKELP
jgi:hypothetical protein